MPALGKLPLLGKFWATFHNLMVRSLEQEIIPCSVSDNFTNLTQVINLWWASLTQPNLCLCFDRHAYLLTILTRKITTSMNNSHQPSNNPQTGPFDCSKVLNTYKFYKQAYLVLSPGFLTDFRSQSISWRSLLPVTQRAPSLLVSKHEMSNLWPTNAMTRWPSSSSCRLSANISSGPLAKTIRSSFVDSTWTHDTGVSLVFTKGHSLFLSMSLHLLVRCFCDKRLKKSLAFLCLISSISSTPLSWVKGCFECKCPSYDKGLIRLWRIWFAIRNLLMFFETPSQFSRVWVSRKRKILVRMCHSPGLSAR